MPRARWDKSGIVIARQGFNVDTAGQSNILFSSGSATRRIYMQGTIAFGGAVTIGPYSNHYQKSTVTFASPFVKAPQALVGVKDNTLNKFILPTQAIVGGETVSSTWWDFYEPVICAFTFTDRLELYTRYALQAALSQFAYCVFENSAD
ncbi:hypothetical protein [Mesorhizobium sp.]|uniref:hypothetical protein n=1 Tax=Mesorhizobium sp. TaxID=1871066 RepID=UPI000FE7FE72|nr:hypothetical protein [Mesorhizobium sp.]RWC58931.1 MAG: hypothetical protein EOS56_18655 [Mesorhizobium sp.]RWC66543.1 MAG: hypothetical protein EOS29_04010 [Mesorhizobium sp.]